MTLLMLARPSRSSMIGSEKITFSPVLTARCSSRMRSAGTPRDTMPALMIEHTERCEPGVTPPLTSAQRKSPSRQSSHAFLHALVGGGSAAKQEEEISRPQRRAHQVLCIDLSDLVGIGQAGGQFLHGMTLDART